MLKITDSEEMGAVIVHPRGKLDTLTAKAFEQHMQQHVDAGGGPLLVDMSGVDYVSSFGLRSILILAKKLAPFGRKFVLFSPNQSVHDVLRVSGFLKIVTVTETREAALAAIAPAAG
jgi:anti-sigma B factor antagonist/stage II sporulation protein AA (anti-sigma F factor antagonist)